MQHAHVSITFTVQVIHIAPFEVTDFMLETADNHGNKIGDFSPPASMKSGNNAAGESDMITIEDLICERNHVYFKFQNDNQKLSESNVTWNWIYKNNWKSSAQNHINFR